MKIELHHFYHIKDAIADRVSYAAYDQYKQSIILEGKAKDVSKRVRWDLAYMTIGSEWICDNIYSYADDSHLDTALKKAIKQIGYE